MPTKHRRHAITETALQAALDELRREMGTDRVDLGELVVLGASAKLAAVREARRRRGAAAAAAAADRVRSRGVPVDVAAADRVRGTGWARE